jgi:hypothetical protein
MTRIRRPKRKRALTKTVPIAEAMKVSLIAECCAEMEAKGWPMPKVMSVRMGLRVWRWSLTFRRSSERGREMERHSWQTPPPAWAKG